MQHGEGDGLRWLGVAGILLAAAAGAGVCWILRVAHPYAFVGMAAGGALAAGLWLALGRFRVWGLPLAALLAFAAVFAWRQATTHTVDIRNDSGRAVREMRLTPAGTRFEIPCRLAVGEMAEPAVFRSPSFHGQFTVRGWLDDGSPLEIVATPPADSYRRRATVVVGVGGRVRIDYE